MTASLWLSFYGDDFTGSADALEALALAGVRTALFLEPPSPAMLREHFPGLQAIGVAGTSGAMTPAQMDEALPLVFAQIAELNAPIFHYKTCSTFDSSPQVGSIGRALELGQQVFQSPFVPLMVGAPVMLRREQLDFVDIITGVETHSELVDLAARLRVPVICQKAMAVSLAEATTMVQTCYATETLLLMHE